VRGRYRYLGKQVDYRRVAERRTPRSALLLLAPSIGSGGGGQRIGDSVGGESFIVLV